MTMGLAGLLLACDSGPQGSYAPRCVGCARKLPDGGVGTCDDGLIGGAETDIDCGGPACDPCGKNSQCEVDSDCANFACVEGFCDDADCMDAKSNAAETGPDCGGPACLACLDGETCNVDRDCYGLDCASGKCTGSMKATFEFPSAAASLCEDFVGGCKVIKDPLTAETTPTGVSAQGTALKERFTATGLTSVDAAAIELPLLIDADLCTQTEPMELTVEINDEEVGSVFVSEEEDRVLVYYPLTVRFSHTVEGVGEYGDDFTISLMQAKPICNGSYSVVYGGTLTLYAKADDMPTDEPQID